MHNDKQIYFIYFIIENFVVETRRSQVCSRTIQLEFLSIVKSKNTKIKTEIYHRALKIIFQRELQFEHYNTLINNDSAFKTLAVADKIILYTNNYYRHYHSIIIDFKINYEKQILIMKVKINHHYIICIILFYERKNPLQR